MRRRSYIALVGSMVVAGCTSSESASEPAEDQADGGQSPDSDETATSDDATETDTPTDEPDETDTPTDAPAVGEAVIQTHELVIDEDDYSTDAYVQGEIENVGDGPTGTIETTARFYDADGNLLESSNQFLSTLGPGETWRVYTLYLGDGEEVDSHEFEAKYAEEIPAPSNDGISLDEHELHATEDDVTVVGTATNNRGEAVDYLEANAKFYYDDKVVAGTNYTNVTDLPDGDSWRFEIDFTAYHVAPREEISDYDVWITDQA